MTRFDEDLTRVLMWADKVEMDAGMSGASHDCGAQKIRDQVSTFKDGLEGRLPNTFVTMIALQKKQEEDDRQRELRRQEAERKVREEQPGKIDEATQRVKALKAKLAEEMPILVEKHRWSDIKKSVDKIERAEQQLGDLKRGR